MALVLSFGGSAALQKADGSAMSDFSKILLNLKQIVQWSESSLTWEGGFGVII